MSAKSRHRGLFAAASADDLDAPAMPASEPPEPAERTSKIAKARQGKRAVMAFVSPEAFKQLKILMAHEDRTVQDVVVEGLNLVFEKRGMNRIA